MKLKGLLFSALITGTFVFSQEKEIKFTKEFNYSLKGAKDINASPSVKVYASKSGELLSDLNYNNLPILFYYDKLGMSPVSFTLNSKLKESYLSNIMGLGFGFTPQTKVVDIEKLNTQETIAGTTCQNYLIDFKIGENTIKKSETSDDETVDNRLKICIDEKNDYNNFPLMIKIIDQFSAQKSTGTNLKGLVLKLGDNINYDKEYLIVDNIKNSDATVKIDHRKILLDVQKKADSLAKSFADITQDYKITDSISANTDYTDYIPDYVSTYKNQSEEEPSLAIDNEYNQAYLKKIPAHCTNLKSKIPVFENKDLNRHVYNYTGQICDLYLTPIEFDTVDEKTTIDEIRREVLYFIDIREKLSQSDKKKLDKFLNNLD